MCMTDFAHSHSNRTDDGGMVVHDDDREAKEG